MFLFPAATLAPRGVSAVHLPAAMPDDAALLHRARSGDPEAFRALVVRYERLVGHVVARVVADPADREDVAQETFLRVHKGLAGFRGEASLATWIARIAYHTALRHAHTRRPTPTGVGAPDGAAEPAGTDDAGAQTEADARDRVLRAAIDALPPAHRVALTLFHLDGFSHAQTAHVLGLPLGTLKNTLFRARQRLKDILPAAAPADDRR